MSVLGTRYGHTEGRVGLVYSGEGDKVVTLGTDGDMRVWTGFDDDDCENYLVGDEGLSLAVSDSKIFVGASQTNLLQAYNWDGDSEGVVTRFTADVTCLSVSNDLLAAGSADMTIKVLHATEFSVNCELSGHEGPILSLSLTRQGDILASSSCDGTVRVWQVGSKSVLKSLPVVPKSNDIPNSKTVCGLKFSRCGNHLAVPVEGGVQVLSREDNWDKVREGKVSSLATGELVTSLDWDMEGSLLLGGTNKGNLVLLQFPTLNTLKVINSGRKANICSVAWRPNTNEASFADLGGHWGLVEDLDDSSEKSNTGKPAQEDEEDMEALFNDDDENSFSIAKVQQETGYVKTEDGNLTFGAGRGEEGENRPDSALSEASSGVKERGRREVVVMPPKVRVQPMFQPGASPATLSNRFLVYNSVGLVRGHETSEESSLDIEFHDSAVHHALHLSNSEGYTISALSSTLLALASPGDPEVDSPAKLTVHYFSSGDLAKEWTVSLEEGETILGVAAGQAWAAVATSRHLLRIFTAGGIQREVVSLPGPPVTMAGEGDRLLLAWHSSHPLPGQQSIACTLYSVSPRSWLLTPLTKGPLSLPLTPGSELYWVGFSDTHSPVVTDSEGMLQVLDLSTQLWHPLLNTRQHSKGKSDFHYMVSVSQVEGVARCVLCKGARYPPTVPRPLPVALPLEVPLAMVDTDKGGLEQQAVNLALQGRLVQHSTQEEAQDCLANTRTKEVECLMKLFALACRSDHESRAVEVARLMPDVDTVQLAIKYAAKLRRAGLADKLGKLALELLEQEESQEQEEGKVQDDEESQDMFAPTQQENPLLAAVARRDSLPKPGLHVNIESQGRQETRNPFAKKVPGGSSSPAPGSQSIVFDSLEVEKKSQLGSSGGSKGGFGDRRQVETSATKSGASKRPIVVKKPLIVKENTAENGQEGHLKGFSLYLAEQRTGIEGDQEKVQEVALSQWKGLSKEEKEAYKTPRLPLVKTVDEGGKRKRDELEGGEKENVKNAKQKLAGFAFSAN